MMSFGASHPDVQNGTDIVGERQNIQHSAGHLRTAGSVVYRDTILMLFLHVATQYTVLTRFNDLDDDSKESFLRLTQAGNMSMDYLTTYQQNQIVFPALAGCGSEGSILPTHGLPFDHGCIPNAICVIESDLLEIRLTKDLGTDEKICLCYCPMTLPVLERRSFMSRMYGIENHSCSACLFEIQTIVNGIQRPTVDSRRRDFFDTVISFQNKNWKYMADGEAQLCEEAREINERGLGMGLDPYLRDIFSKAERKAREAKFDCNILMARYLLNIIDMQAGL
ncbi:hypothetical protein SBOR_9609 [Sclerotinia borealis F-4128]|uniref:SET domain-containing protein n=1 Tax=Sclerotinia borealis (strain F-4128) TaxID=1432307 RepID=W9C284_SCLBF|nr:hypothetical protein SBOR_9609 [Sclerotinia borealis F-4128]